jgi:hypothetical protein
VGVEVTELDVPEPALSASEIWIVGVESLDVVGAQLDVRDVPDVFHEPPYRVGFGNDPQEFSKEPVAFFRVPVSVGVGVIDAGRSADHSVKAVARDVEVFDGRIPQQIGTENNGVTFQGESSP